MCSLLWSQTLTCSSLNFHLNVFHQMVPLSLIPSLYITSDYCIIHILAIISMPAKDNIYNFSVQFYLHFFMLYPSTLEINMSIFFFIIYPLIFFFLNWTSLVAQTVKLLPTMRETWVQSLGREDLLEKEMATHSSILAWKIPWTEEPGRAQSMGSQRVKHDWVTSLFFNS